MNNITRPLIPRGILFDEEFPPPTYPEPKVFDPLEICIGYWRVRAWRIYGAVSFLAGGGLQTMDWDFDVTVPANNRRGGPKIDTVGGKQYEVPEFSEPRHEIDLTRTYGTFYPDGRYTAAFHHTVDDPVEGPFAYTNTSEQRIEIGIFDRVSRQWNADDWKASVFKASCRVVIYGEPYFGSDVQPVIIVGYGGGAIGETPYPVPWECIGFRRSLIGVGAALDGPSLPPAPIQLAMRIEPAEVDGYWGYGDNNGNSPKFNTTTGSVLRNPLAV